MKTRAFGIALGLALLAAMAAHAMPQGDPLDCSVECEDQKFLDHNIGVPLDRPVTLAELRKFAPLVSEDKRTIPNPQAPGQSDVIHEFHYSGLTITAEVTAEGTVLVQRIALTGGNYAMLFHIRLGAIEGPHDIDWFLGAPSETRHDADGKNMDWIYWNPEHTGSVTFIRGDSDIKSVIWDYGGD